VLSPQSCSTLGDPMDCRLPGSSVYGDYPGKNTDVKDPVGEKNSDDARERIITESPGIGKRDTFDVLVEGLILVKNGDSSPKFRGKAN